MGSFVCAQCATPFDRKTNTHFCSTTCRFWSYVSRTEGCWEWTGTIQYKGYGEFRVGPQRGYAHRFSYLLAFGPVPLGQQVLHHCDNRRCVRPSHLFLGSGADNMADMMHKGRHNPVNGERNKQAKLTQRDIREIRRRSAKGETRESISQSFSVTPQHIGRIARKQPGAWRWVAT